MAMVGLKVPKEVARLLSGMKVPGQKETSDQYHITISYLGDEVPTKQLGKAIVALHDVARKVTPFTVSVSTLVAFPEGSDGYPIVGLVESPELHQLEKAVKSALGKAGVDYSKKFPVYRPHVTLAYSPESIQNLDLDRPVNWSVYDLVLWGGDSGDERLCTTFPFPLTQEKTAIWRRLVQAALHK